MPGSYPDPQLFANEALQALERAYEGSKDAGTGSLILTAIEAVQRLKAEIRTMRHAEEYRFDPYEINESNSAI